MSKISKINQTVHVMSYIKTENLEKFSKDINNAINDVQNNNLEVEVQYQQSDDYCSALILGREK